MIIQMLDVDGLVFGLMLCSCKANPVLSSVEDAVILRQKYVSQNPQRTLRGNYVYCLETTETQLPVAKHLLKIERHRQTDGY